MTIEEECEKSVLRFAPYYRQIKANSTGEHLEYINVVLTLHTDWYDNIINNNGTSWVPLPDSTLQYLSDTKPYK